MAATRRKTLGTVYKGLAGAALIDALAERGATDVLEAFWRYGHAQVAADVAPTIFASGDMHLLALVLDEILSPSLEQPAHQVIVSAVSEHQPALAKADGERLAEHLHSGLPLHGYYEPARPILLAWLVSQPGKVGEDAALAVIAGGTLGSDSSDVQHAAYSRCRGGGGLLAAAAGTIGTELGRRASPQTWQQACDFIDRACHDEQSTPASVVPIVQLLVETAPSYGPSRPFSDALVRLALDCAIETIESHVSGNLTDSVGARAIIDLLPGITPASRRATLWASAARTQQQLWPFLQEQTVGWEEAEWRRVLRALAGPDPVYRPALDHLVKAAPPELTAQFAHVAMTQVPSDDPLINDVGERLSTRLTDVGDAAETRDAWLAAIHWPKPRDEESIEKFDAIVSCLDADLHVRLLIRGYHAKKLSADLAARLVPVGEVGNALTMMAAGSREEWTAALAAAHTDEIAQAAAEVTTPDDFGLDVVAGLAPTRPEIAFSGAAAAWPHMSAQQKEILLPLLETHGTADSIDALCAVIRDDHRDNAARRGRAARRIGALLEAGSALPDAVLDLLNSNRSDLREAAVEAIERVRPREPELIARLHDVAAAGGAAGVAAANALDGLTREFLSELTNASDKSELHEVIPLLGAVGRAAVLQPLFDHVGTNAVYDDPALHRQAAAAIHEAADRIEDEVSSEDQEALVTLIDGDEQETDVAARAELSSALARLQLGDDAALSVLYALVKLTPKVAPDRLFAAEKEPLVRQLALYDRARKRGQDGWGAELAHLDNIAERLVRSAYLAADGTSAAIIEQIKNDSRTPDYGNLITSLASTKQLNAIQAPCKVLHDARCDFSEIPHAGKQADGDTMTTARKCFITLAKVCLGTLQRHHGGP